MKEENENKKSHYIFFIETHDISRKFKLSFSDKLKDKEVPEIEYINQKLSKYKDFISLIYRFKIKEIKKDLELILLLEE